MPTSKDFDGFTDKDLKNELIRRAKQAYSEQCAEREARSAFLLACVNELLIITFRDKDEELYNFARDARDIEYWDNDYDVELRLVKYPPLSEIPSFL